MDLGMPELIIEIIPALFAIYHSGIAPSDGGAGGHDAVLGH
jgi:hypothetical protein